jgi:hypothetical protein
MIEVCRKTRRLADEVIEQGMAIRVRGLLR